MKKIINGLAIGLISLAGFLVVLILAIAPPVAIIVAAVYAVKYLGIL